MPRPHDDLSLRLVAQEEQIELAKEAGITIQICAPSLGLMGFDDDEWIVPIEVCGFAAMYSTALKARTAYFIS